MTPERLAEIREYAEGDDNLRDAVAEIDALTRERDRMLFERDVSQEVAVAGINKLEAKNARLAAEVAKLRDGWQEYHRLLTDYIGKNMEVYAERAHALYKRVLAETAPKERT